MHDVGASIFLCKPERKVVAKYELVKPVRSSMQDTLELGVRGLAAVQGTGVVWYYESAPRDECFGGWPAAALVPTTPLRLLRFDVRTMWPVPIPARTSRQAINLSPNNRPLLLFCRPDFMRPMMLAGAP